MRIFERLTYIANLTFILWYNFHQEIKNNEFRDLISIVLSFGFLCILFTSAVKEGLRSG